MKTRQVVIFSGEQFTVPQGIQRIDTRSTHGWQVRYHGTKMFSDHTPDGSGAAAALVRATKELLRRINEMPAPVTLQGRPSANKTSGLPSGISGPIVRQRKGAKLRTANLSVLVPRYGMSPRCRTVYIGNENTYTVERYQAALDRAIQIRQEAEEVYAVEATKAKRKAAKLMKAMLADAMARAAQSPAPTATRKRAVKAAAAPASAARKASRVAAPLAEAVAVPTATPAKKGASARAARKVGGTAGSRATGKGAGAAPVAAVEAVAVPARKAARKSPRKAAATA
ncbi:MAG: hypothetical protein RL223_2492 [Pseudomonadota bacterium]|jgi:hypothetical protein